MVWTWEGWMGVWEMKSLETEAKLESSWSSSTRRSSQKKISLTGPAQQG